MADRVLLPTFIIGGAPRSGTTFLCHALDRHPDIYIAKPYIPEPKVFMGPIQDITVYKTRYSHFFIDVNEQSVLGEKTSYYLESALICKQIHLTLPQIKMLFIVREPIARAYSNYLWSKKNRLETLSFEEAIELEGRRPNPLPPEKAYAKPFDYLTRGDYATFAQNYYDVFGRDNIAFFLYEDITQQPEILFYNIQRFIGVEPLPFCKLDVGIVNSAGENVYSIDIKTENNLRLRMAPLIERFSRLTGMDLSSWGY